MYLIMYVLFHDNVSEGVSEGVVFLIEHKRHTCHIVWVVQRHLRGGGGGGRGKGRGGKEVWGEGAGGNGRSEEVGEAMK